MKSIDLQGLGIDVAGIDRRLADNWSLPTRFYHDPAIFQFEQEAIFARNWLYFGSVLQVANPEMSGCAVWGVGRWL